MRTAAGSMLVVGAFLHLASASAVQERGFLAIDADSGRYAFSVYGEADAVNMCGTTDCEVVASFTSCMAVARSSLPQGGQDVWTWWEGASEAVAGQGALGECRAAGGPACGVISASCLDARAVEQTLALDQPTRRLIQESLEAAGFSPGALDGIIGPATRGAIRRWQASRGARATGYLNRAEIDALGGRAPRAAARASAAANAASGGPPAAPPLPASSELELVFWQSIMNSTNPADFEAYLEQFPNGTFRRLAQNRLAVLREPSDDRLAVEGTGSGSAADVSGASTAGTAAVDARRPTPRGSIDFGDDTSEFAHDGECDDARFEGTGMSLPAGVAGSRGRDAADCRRHYDANRISLYGVDLDSRSIDFGDDPTSETSWWVRDGYCDDPRFDGEGMSPYAIGRARGHDAADCRRLYDAGRIRLFGVDLGGVR